MNKVIFAIFGIALFMLPTNGETTQKRKPLSMAERVALQKRIALKRTGGIVRKENSAKGAFAILNAQTIVSEKEIKPILEQIEKTLLVNTIFTKANDVTVENVESQIKAAGGTVGTAIVDSKELPTFIAAPETGWTVINVSKLAKGCTDKSVLASRVRKEVMRSLAFTTGCIYTTVADPLMRDVTKPGDIDALPSEEFGFEIINRFMVSAPLYGLKPWYQTTYKKACEEGWAPTPTNDVQKRVWDKVHAAPKAPMKIEFDPKKGR